ncbi:MULTISPECIES: hypothetical protein [unclassified Nonomuraea]
MTDRVEPEGGKQDFLGDGSIVHAWRTASAGSGGVPGRVRAVGS